MPLDKLLGGSGYLNTPCIIHFSSRISNVSVNSLINFLLITMSFLSQSANVGFYCLQLRTLTGTYITWGTMEVIERWVWNPEVSELLFLYRYPKGCHVEEKHTGPAWLQKAKPDQGGKFWGEILQLNTRQTLQRLPSGTWCLGIRWACPRSLLALVEVGPFCQGYHTEMIYSLDKVPLLLRYSSIFNCILEQFRCHFSN